MRLTVGPLPAAVYWRRRAIVLVAALLVVFLVAQACIAATASPGNDASGDPAPSPGSSAAQVGGLVDPVLDLDGGEASTVDDDADDADAGSPAADQPPPEGEQCTDDEMLITAEAERTEFDAGDPVRFTIRIRNQSDRPCVRDVGGDHRELYLIHGTGANRVWSSRDCAPPHGSEERQLDPHFESEHFLVWHGHASTSCDGDEPGGALVAAGEYQLYAMLGSARSEPVSLTIG